MTQQDNTCLTCGEDSPCGCDKPMPAAETYAKHRDQTERFEPYCDCLGGHVQMIPDPNGRWRRDAEPRAEVERPTSDAPVPTPGDCWAYYNGTPYRVLHIANLPDNPWYPQTVVYQGSNGRIWSRPLSDWHRSMTLTKRADRAAPEGQVRTQIANLSVWAGKAHPEQQLVDLAHVLAILDTAQEAVPTEAGAEPFQSRVQSWLHECFGPEISGDRLERSDRLLEEVFELLQSSDYPRERIASLSSYVWSRPKGEPAQEVGGVMVTLAGYCLAHGIDMHDAGETELARVWTKVEKIRAKQAAKPTGSALPQAWPDATQPAAPTDNTALVEEMENLKDCNGKPPLTKEEMARFRELFPLDHLSRVALAAWVNVRPDQLPKEMQAHNCPATMEAWGRVAHAIEAALASLEASPASQQEAMTVAEDDILADAEAAYWADPNNDSFDRHCIRATLRALKGDNNV